MLLFSREDLKSRAGLTCAIGDAGRDGSLFEIAFQVPQLYAVVWRKKWKNGYGSFRSLILECRT
jgi:hypothetical protein